MTKVCHLTSTHGNHDQRILIKECCSLVKAGYDVYQVAQGKNEEYNGVQLIGTDETKKGAAYRLLIRPYKVYRLAKKIDADVYQIHDMELLPYAVKLKKSGKKVIFDYHEDFASRFADSDIFHLPKGIMKLLGKIYCNYEKKSIAKLDAMISVTPHICKRLKEANPNTVMITNYPIISEDSPWAQTTSYNPNSEYICFAGQVSCVQYALDTVVEAIQDLNVRFKIYGPERRTGDIEYLKSIDTKKKMEYCGVIPFNELPVILSKSKVAIVTAAYTKDTNDKEGTLGNNKLFEAMLRGIPVIFTDYDIWKNINQKYKFGLHVEHGNLEHMRNAINYLINNPKEAEMLGKNGREAVYKEFNWSKQEEILLKLYEKIVI